MASAPKAGLPIMYNDLIPLNSRDHSTWRARTVDRAPWVGKQHAVPLTVEEFPMAQRDFPIVFSAGENPVPLALMGLNEGVNVFFEDDGKPITQPYVPAYVRRYPFLLAKIDPNSDNLSLCFDPTTDLIGDFEDGHALFDGDQPSEHTKNLLTFCEKFEEAGNKTKAFMEELAKADLLMDGEVAINRSDEPGSQPFIYRGFRMVNQEKLRELRGDQLRTWNQNGLLPLIHAHLFSLDLMRIIFAKQEEQGKGPQVASVKLNASDAAASVN